MSIDLKDNANSRLRHGTLAQILACSKLTNGKSANALDLPLPLGAFNADALSTDTVAWRDGNKYNPEKVVHYPAKDTKWGLVALAGALHAIHIDAHGTGTYVETLTGAKWWIIAVPLAPSAGFGQFADVSQFFSKHFDLDKSGEGLWRLEAVLLKPGTRLYVSNSFDYMYILIQCSSVTCVQIRPMLFLHQCILYAKVATFLRLAQWRTRSTALCMLLLVTATSQTLSIHHVGFSCAVSCNCTILDL